MDESRKKGDGVLNRREFLGTTAGAGAVTLLGKSDSSVAAEPDSGAAAARPYLAGPSAAQQARDVGAAKPADTGRAIQRAGSDLMVQVLNEMGIEFVAANPAASFEGLQESIVNFSSATRKPNEMPELITALHEETSVDMAHGYAKAEGKPMAIMMHGTVGTMHASMAIYQAFHSQTPVVMIAGRSDTNFRRKQSANDIAGIVRSYTTSIPSPFPPSLGPPFALTVLTSILPIFCPPFAFPPLPLLHSALPHHPPFPLGHHSSRSCSPPSSW